MSGSPPEIRIVDDAQALARAAAEEFGHRAREAVAARGRFTVALSGGSTPGRTYEALAGASPSGPAIPWDRVHLFWGDERHVPSDHPDSNYRMVRETLLDRVPLPEENVHRIRAEQPDPGRAAEEYEATLNAFFGLPANERPRFDLILLGLGHDGHTASLFPGTGAVHEAERLVAAYRVEALGASRITLTPAVINEARRILFLVAGEEKAGILRAVLRGTDPPDRLPARAIRPIRGSLLWMADRSAARLLSS